MKATICFILVCGLQLRAAIPSMEDLTNVVQALIEQTSEYTGTNFTYYSQTQYAFLTITNTVDRTNVVNLTNRFEMYVTNTVNNVTNLAITTNVTYYFTNAIGQFTAASLPPTIQSTVTNLSSPASVVTVKWPQSFGTVNYCPIATFTNGSVGVYYVKEITPTTTTFTFGSAWGSDPTEVSGPIRCVGILHTQ